MGVRELINEVVEGALEFFAVKSTNDEGFGSASSVVPTLTGDEDAGALGAEELEGEFFEHAAILHRPKAPDASGECEVVGWRRGDEVVVVASKDRRWQVEVADGEVVVRAYTATGARIHLLPGGGVIIGADDATLENIALGTSIKSHLDAIKSYIDTHTHIGSATAPTGAISPTGVPNSASPTVPTVESSKHKVEV